MTRATWLCVFLMCGTASALVTPGAAGAAQRAEFRLQASKGFTVHIEVRRRTANLAAERSFGARSTHPAGVGAVYISRGSISRDRVRARFGGRGKIAVAFKARRTVRREPPAHCRGRPVLIRTGVFVGTIRFHGERGYTTVEASRAQGKLRTIANWKCAPGTPRWTPPALVSEAGGPVLLEVEGARNRLNAVTAWRPGEERVTRFIVGRTERRGRMHIRRVAYAYAKEKTFVFDQGLGTATIEPPRPFRGSATFTRGSGDPLWTGSLSVDLPGAGLVPLTGRRYAARLYRGDAEDDPGY